MKDQIISTKQELLNIAKIVTEKINNNEWEQIYIKEDPFCTNTDIRKIYSESPLPDIIQCYLKDLKTNELFLLSAETYHGAGGYLKKQE